MAKQGLLHQLALLKRLHEGDNSVVLPLEPLNRDTYKEDLKDLVRERRLEDLKQLAEGYLKPNKRTGEVKDVDASLQATQYLKATDNGRINRIYKTSNSRFVSVLLHQIQCGIVPSFLNYERRTLFKDGQSCPYCNCWKAFKPTEMVCHVVKECTHFEAERKRLSKKIGDTVGDLLGTELHELFEAKNEHHFRDFIIRCNFKQWQSPAFDHTIADIKKASTSKETVDEAVDEKSAAVQEGGRATAAGIPSSSGEQTEG